MRLALAHRARQFALGALIGVCGTAEHVGDSVERLLYVGGALVPLVEQVPERIRRRTLPVAVDEALDLAPHLGELVCNILRSMLQRAANAVKLLGGDLNVSHRLLCSFRSRALPWNIGEDRRDPSPCDSM